MDHDEFSLLLTYLTCSTYPASFTKQEKRRLREKAKLFKIVNHENHQVLMHLVRKGEYRRVVRTEEKLTIMRATHGGPGASHFGRNATQSKIAASYYWKGKVRKLLVLHMIY